MAQPRNRLHQPCPLRRLLLSPGHPVCSCSGLACAQIKVGMVQPPRKTQLGPLERREREPGLPQTQLGSKRQAALAFPVQLELQCL